MTTLSQRRDPWRWQRSYPTFKSLGSSTLVTVSLDLEELWPLLKPSKTDINGYRYSIVYYLTGKSPN